MGVGEGRVGVGGICFLSENMQKVARLSHQLVACNHNIILVTRRGSVVIDEIQSVG